MRTALFALSCGVLVACPVWAGVYSTVDPVPGPQPAAGGVRAMPFAQFRSVLTDLILVANPQPSAVRERYLARQRELERKVRGGGATPTDRVNLGACLIRLGRYEEAVEALTPAAAEDRRNFMVFANLATAHQLAGRAVRAIDYLGQVGDIIPREWPGFTPDQLAWYARAESYHLKLLRLRAHEEVAAGGRAKAPTTVDDLFGVRFVGSSGKYEPGRLAPAERAKLPKDAVAAVQQLLLWLPGDTRLYWLLGELLNAQGDVTSAAAVFEECVWSRRYDADELKAHRQVVKEAGAAAADETLAQVAWAGGEPPAPAEPVSWLPERRQMVVVGVLAGLAVAFLAYLQVREVRHRRQGPRRG